MLRTELVPVISLHPWPRNYNQHGANQLGYLANSLTTFGQFKNIVIVERKGVRYVVAGHGLVEAAKQAGLSTLEAKVLPPDWSDEKVEALLVADNRLAQLATPDDQLLAELLDSIRVADDTLLESMGYDQAQIADLLNLSTTPSPETTGATDDVPVDKAEELGIKWRIADGQLWQIGDHLVICGDCREPATWQRLLQAAQVDKVNGVFTSPPYAMQRKDQYGGVPTNEYVDWWEAVQANVKANLAQDGSFFVNVKENSEDYIRQIYVSELAVAMVKRWGWIYLDMFCWERAGIPGDPFKMGKFKNQWEPVYWWATITRPKFYPDAVMHKSNAVILDDNYKPTLALNQGKGGSSVMGDRKVGKGMAYPGNRLSIHARDESLGHSAAFPVALPDFFIRAYSDPGDVWLDPFCGSGTTILAAHNNKRRGLGIEKLPKYLGVILERLATTIQAEPHLLST